MQGLREQIHKYFIYWSNFKWHHRAVRRVTVSWFWLVTPLNRAFNPALWLVKVFSKVSKETSYWPNKTSVNQRRFAFRIDRSVGWCGASIPETNHRPLFWRARKCELIRCALLLGCRSRSNKCLTIFENQNKVEAKLSFKFPNFLHLCLSYWQKN